MAAPPTKRCFLALWPDDATRRRLAEEMEPVDAEGLRKTPEANLHLTVKFLGDVREDRVAEVVQAAHAACEGTSPFDLSVERAVFLPNRSRPRVLAARLTLPPALDRLVSRMEDEAEAIGFDREERRFSPHITLGRFKRPKGRKRGAKVDPDAIEEALTLPSATFRVDRLSLMESRLAADGPTYTTVQEVPFPA